MDIFLRLDGIKGEGSDYRRKDEIGIESFTWGIRQTGAPEPGGADRVVQDITIVKRVDKSSPELMLACCNGKQIKAGVITVREPMGFERLKIELNDIIVSSVQQGGSSESMTETLSLNFSKVQMEYQPQGASGAPEGGPIIRGWDFKQNREA
jgi:type VI secretion system secreted protein Hcp